MTYHLQTAAIWAGVGATIAAMWGMAAFWIGVIAYLMWGLFWAGWGLAAWVMG
jgi:hypothetical protein